MERRRRRPGYTIIGLLVVVIVIALLFRGGLGNYVKPRPDAPASVAAALPDEAALQVFRLVAQQARVAASMGEQQSGGKPKSWQDLNKYGLDTISKDPWGGTYYLKDGCIRCTGNPKVREKL